MVCYPFLVLGIAFSLIGYVLAKYGLFLYGCVKFEPEMFEPEPPLQHHEIVQRQNDAQLETLKRLQQEQAIRVNGPDCN